jgi:uncharacterized membrane protein YeaQ/YmgE (transglycosylase-associated protein family)
MGDPEIGWIAAIIIGGIAGWLAELFMKSDTGLIMNIVLGIVGAAIASAILSFFGIVLGGWIGYLIAGFIGACLLIWIVRAVRGRTVLGRAPSNPVFPARGLEVIAGHHVHRHSVPPRLSAAHTRRWNLSTLTRSARTSAPTRSAFSRARKLR